MSEYDEIGEQLDAYIARLGAQYGYSPDSETPDSYRAFSVGVMRSMIFSMARSVGHSEGRTMSDHDMTERLADVLVAKVTDAIKDYPDVLVAKVTDAIKDYPGTDDERASILAKVSTKLTKIAQGDE